MLLGEIEDAAFSSSRIEEEEDDDDDEAVHFESETQRKPWAPAKTEGDLENVR